MSIIRKKRYDKPFIQVEKQIFLREDISLQAKGLFAFLMTLPDDWDINIQHLYKQSKNGRDGTAKAMNELISIGYVTRARKHNTKGNFEGYDYTVYETISDAPKTLKAVNGKPVNGKSVNGKQVTTDNPLTDKQITNKTKSVVSVPKTKAQAFAETIEQAEFPASFPAGLNGYLKRYFANLHEVDPQKFCRAADVKKIIKQVYSIREGGHSDEYLIKLIALCNEKGWRSVSADYLKDVTNNEKVFNDGGVIRPNTYKIA